MAKGVESPSMIWLKLAIFLSGHQEWPLPKPFQGLPPVFPQTVSAENLKDSQ